MSAVLHVPTVKRLGRHVIAEFWDVEPSVLCGVGLLESIFVDACRESGATVLHSNFHGFGEGCGVTGVVILSESHASVHTWPEYGTACVDIFMCGRTNDLDAALAVIVAGLAARVERQAIHRRVFGRLDSAAVCGGQADY